MGRRAKLEKFAEIQELPNVFENFDPSNPKLLGEHGAEVELKGKWNSVYFKNDNPIVLECACGKGDYTIGLAEMNPDKNYIGVDIKGARIWRGAKTAIEKKLANVAFLRTRIEQLDLFFEQDEVSEIWITFPDPFPRESKENRRLTSNNFLQVYRNILVAKGLLHLKTDADSFFDFTLERFAENDEVDILYQNKNIYQKELDFAELELKTFYEKQHLKNGRTIKYLRAHIN